VSILTKPFFLVYLLQMSYAISARKYFPLIYLCAYTDRTQRICWIYNSNVDSERQFLVGRFPGQVYYSPTEGNSKSHYSVICHCLPRKATSVRKFRFCRGSNLESRIYQASALSVTFAFSQCIGYSK